jgi:hypothetical protein
MLAGLLGIGAIALGLGLAVPQLRRQGLPSELELAKGRWAAAALRHYRLITLSGNPCRLEVEVRDERVVEVLHEDPCSHPARTVTTLFNLVEHAVSPLYTCAPPSCACRHVVTVYARYDAQVGYPQKVAVRVERQVNWSERPFWRYLWTAGRLPDCAWASNADIVNVLALTPLQ